ncbi:MAG: GDP-mannose 4,6-dehydratase [Gemmatimonadota bacterium]
MKVLVTGADGFVGEHLVELLLEKGYDVSASALTLPPTRDTLRPERIGEVDWKAADVLDHDALFRLVAAVRPDHIYHLAGFSSGALAREQVEVAMRVNAGGTINLCEAVLAARDEFPSFDPRILVMGSGEAYGSAALKELPLREEMPLRPLSPYGLSKACQEFVAHTYRRARGLRTVVVRGFNLLGPGQRVQFVVPSFCAQVAEIAGGQRDPVLHVGNLDVERDFTDVRDGVKAYHAIMGLEKPKSVYNVCSGSATPIRRLLEWILDEAGVEAEIRVDASRVREEETPRIIGDASRVREETGWAPTRYIEGTVREVYGWIAAQVNRPGGPAPTVTEPERQ